MTDEHDNIRIHVHPDPEPHEMAAIAAAIAGLACRRDAPQVEERPSRSNGRERWAAAGRREVLRTIEQDV